MYRDPYDDYQPKHPHLFLYSAGNAGVSSKRKGKVKKLIERMYINPRYSREDAIWKDSGYECLTMVKDLKRVKFNAKKDKDKDWEMRFDKDIIMQYFELMPHEPFYKYYDYGTGAGSGPIKFHRYKGQFKKLSKEAEKETKGWEAGKLPISKHRTMRGFYLEINAKKSKPPKKKCLKKK